MAQNNGNIEVRPVRKEETSAVDLCIARSFSDDPEHPVIPGFIKIELADPDFFWGVFVDNVPVAGLKLVPFELSIDGMSLKMLGLTGVGTDPNHRHKGYASRLLQAVHKFAESRDYDGALLHSAADRLYQKNGYEFSFCQWQSDIKFNRVKEFYSNHDEFSSLDEKEEVDFVLLMDLTDDLISDLYKIREGSIDYRNRRLKAIRTVDYMKSQMSLLLNKGLFLAVLRQSDSPIAYLIVDRQKDRIEIVEFISINDSKEDLLRLLHEFLEEFEELPQVLKYNIYFEDATLKEIIQDMNGSLSRNPLTGNMTNLFCTEKILEKMVSVFKQRLIDSSYFTNVEVSSSKSLSESFFLKIGNEGYKFSISNSTEEAKFSFNIDKTDLKADFSTEVLSNERNCLQNNIISMSKLDWIVITMGFASVSDLDVADEDEFEQFELIFSILYPELEPVWDYFQKY